MRLGFWVGFFGWFISTWLLFQDQYFLGILGLLCVLFLSTIIKTYEKRVQRNSEMSIDASIVGFTYVKGRSLLVLNMKHREIGKDDLFRLYIEKFQESWSNFLPNLISCEVWGNSSRLMLGEFSFAERITHTDIKLVDDWQQVVICWRKANGLRVS